MKGFGTGLNSWYGWVHRYGSASWIIAMKANASSCGITTCDESCLATIPTIHPTTIQLVLPCTPIFPARKQYPLSASLPNHLSSPASSHLSFISHYPLRAHNRAATAGTYLLANPPRQNGPSQWLQRGIRLAQKEKKQS